MSSELILIVGSFGAVSMIMYFITRLVLGSAPDTKLRDRLNANPAAPQPQIQKGSSNGPGGMVSTLQSIGQAAAQPFMPKNRDKQSNLRKKLGEAGIYSPSAIRAVTGFKFILLMAGMVGGYVLGGPLGIGNLGGFSLGGIIGYMAPTLWLNHRVRTNQKELQYGLAD